MRDEIGHGASSATGKGWPAHLMSKAYHSAKDAVLAHFEKEYLATLVMRADRNMSKAARLAGIDRTTLYRLLEKHEVATANGGTSATGSAVPPVEGEEGNEPLPFPGAVVPPRPGVAQDSAGGLGGCGGTCRRW